jgi:hypothetical protein
MQVKFINIYTNYILNTFGLCKTKLTMASGFQVMFLMGGAYSTHKRAGKGIQLLSLKI